MNLRSKIIIITVMTMALAMGANGLLSCYVFVNAYTKTLEEQSSAIGQSLKVKLDWLLDLDIPLHDLEGFEKQCSDLVSKYNSVEYAMVADHKGRIIFHSDTSQHGNFIDITDIQRQAPSTIELLKPIEFYKLNNHTILETRIPIIDKHEAFLGYAIVGFPEKIVINKRNRLLISSSFIMVIFILSAALILVLVISIYVTNPIGNFIEHIRVLRDPNCKRVDFPDSPTSDEIGKLRTAFMDLIKDLDASQITIKIHAHKLEETVAKRTKELQIAKQHIAAREKAEEALRESEARSKTIVNAVQTAIIIIDAKSNIIVEANPMALQLLDATFEEVREKSIRKYLRSADKTEQATTVEILAVEPSERLLVSQNRKPIPILLSTTPTRLNKRSCVIASFIDLRRLKAAEAERDRLGSQLRQAQKLESIGTLAGGIAHDFNNILYAMMGYVELCLDDAPKNSILEENLRYLLEGGMRAKDLVRQILTFARRAEEKVEPVIVSTIAKEALKLTRSSIPTTIEMRINLRSNSRIIGNATQVHQIIMNLCTNAAQAMEHSGGVLEVELIDLRIERDSPHGILNMPSGPYIQLSVTDNGCGIEPEDLNTVFEPYFTTKVMGKGTGMGLSVVQGIVESYGGKISVQSELGKGTTFTVLFPTTSGKSQAASTASESVSSGGGRILFIDDETMITKMAGQILERHDYTVTTKSNSIDALALFVKNPDAFDLVITDMTMPKITGDQLAKEILSIRPDMPIMICTGYSSKINEEDALKLGVKAFIYKPIEKHKLINTIDSVLVK